MESKTIGELMRDDSSGWGTVARLGGYLIYAGAVIYITAHNLSLFPTTLPNDLRVWAYVSVAILALNAVVLPIGIHTVFTPGGQREWATLFYIGDIVAGSANVVIDSMLNRGALPQGFEKFYYDYVVVIVPIVFGVVCWAVIWLADPEKRLRDAIAATRAASIRALTERLKDEMHKDNASDEVVRQAAAQIGRDVVRQVTGRAVDDVVRGNGHLQGEREYQSAVTAPSKRRSSNADNGTRPLP